MIAGVLAALRFAPAVLGAGREIVGALTGEEPPQNASAEDVADLIERLPPEERRTAVQHVLHAKTRHQELDTQRFLAANAGPAERIRATARPEIALRATGVLVLFARGVALLFVMVSLEWLVRAVCAIAGVEDLDLPSVAALIAMLEPVTELVWAPLIASFWASADVVKKYMGCRERDKARADEMTAGRPLDAAQATVADAGGAIAGIVRALKGR